MGQAKGTVMALISPTVVEQKYGIPVAQLRRWRRAGAGPEYFQLGARSIRYYTPDLDDWLQGQANTHQDHIQARDVPHPGNRTTSARR